MMRINRARITPVLSLACLLVFVLFDGSYAAENEWELIKDAEGIQLYRQSVQGSKYDRFKGIGIVHAKIEVIGMVLRDPPAYPKWMWNCKKSRIVEKFDENNMIVYYVHKNPWPVKDRDVVLRATTTIAWDSGWFRVDLISVEDTRVPPKDNLVRMSKMTGSWFVEYVERERTKVTYTFTFDPAGSVLASLANNNMKNFPHNTLRGMREIVKQGKYVEAAYHSKDREILERYIREGRLRK
jgi:hypothetical protein